MAVGLRKLLLKEKEFLDEQQNLLVLSSVRFLGNLRKMHAALGQEIRVSLILGKFLI